MSHASPLHSPADSSHATSLTDAERRAWREDGFFVRRDGFTAAELDELRAAAERVVGVAAAAADQGERYAYDGNLYVDAAEATVQYEHLPDSRTIRVIEPFHHLDARLDALVDDARLVDPMRGLVGSARLALWTDKLNLKRPHEGSGFRWHQDSPYWTHACSHVDRLPNVMLALDDAHVGNGCLRVVRGSHRQGVLPGIRDDTQLGALFTDPAAFDESQQVPVEVSAGSLIFFSPHTVHGSGPNESDQARRALVVTYQPGDQPMFKRAGVRNVGVQASSSRSEAFANSARSSS